MAQAPTRTSGIPPDPNAGKNIHGQPNYPAPGVKTNVPGQPPQSDMAPPEEASEGLGDNTRAEMDAGKKNLAQYSKRNDAEHQAGQRAIGRSSPKEQPQE